MKTIDAEGGHAVELLSLFIRAEGADVRWTEVVIIDDRDFAMRSSCWEMHRGLCGVIESGVHRRRRRRRADEHALTYQTPCICLHVGGIQWKGSRSCVVHLSLPYNNLLNCGCEQVAVRAVLCSLDVGCKSFLEHASLDGVTIDQEAVYKLDVTDEVSYL